MGLCSHQPGDAPSTYVYKVRIKQYCVQISLMMFAVLPLMFIVSKLIFQARLHTVKRVEVIASNIDLSSGNVTIKNLGDMHIMQFDESLEVLQAQQLCSAQIETTIQRDVSNCDSFNLGSETSIEFCGTTGLTSASKRGQGSYYYPTAPEWDATAETWRTVGLQRFYMTGSTILHRLDDLNSANVIFKGYPEFKETETFWKMPCDQTLDEVLLGILVIMILRVVICTMQMLEEMSKLNFVQVNDSEPVRFGLRAMVLKWLVRLDLLCLSIIIILLGVLYNMFTLTKRCKYDVPELYWTSAIVLLYCFACAIILGLIRLRTFVYQDADPGVCNKSCQEKFSANVMMLPCGHMPGSKEPMGTSSQDSMRMCYACSHLYNECPVSLLLFHLVFFYFIFYFSNNTTQQTCTPVNSYTV